VRPGWTARQGPNSTKVLEIDETTGTLTVVSVAGFGAGAFTLEPSFKLYLKFDLDVTARLIHCRAFRTEGYLGQVGDLVGNTAIKLPDADPFPGWVNADLNGAFMATKQAAGAYRMAHCGVYLPVRDYLRSSRAVSTNALAPGDFLVNLPTGEASEDGWEVGMLVYLTDIATGEIERHFVDVVNVGLNRLELHEVVEHNFAIGSIISRDPHPLALSGSAGGILGPQYTAQAPDKILLDPLSAIANTAQTFDPLTLIQFAGDAEGASSVSAARLVRIGQNRTEQIGVHPRAYEFAVAPGGGFPHADEAIVAFGRESVQVFTEDVTGRKIAARRSALGLLLVDA
jgi:hypothetical protein